MKISEENKKIIVDWVSEKCGQLRCTCCGNNQLTLVEISNIQIGFDLDSTRFHYHEGLATASIACNNCGYLMQFATAAMGIKPKPIPEEKIEE